MSSGGNGERPARGLDGRTGAVLGGLGLAAPLIWLAHLPLPGAIHDVASGIGWVAAAAIAGWAYGTRWAWASLGVSSSLGLVVALDALVIGYLPGEWSGFDKVIWRISMVVVAVFPLLPAMIGTLAHDGAESPRLARRASRVGVAVVAASALSFATLLVSPATSSFALSLGAHWEVVPADRSPETAAYGHHLTAVHGSATPPDRSGWPSDPVVGVSVTRGNGEQDACYRAWNGWPGDPSPLYEAAPVDWGSVTLSAGPAYRVVRAGPDGSVMVGYAMARDRFVGVVLERVCYLLVVTIPAGSDLTEADAARIADGFRFE